MKKSKKYYPVIILCAVAMLFVFGFSGVYGVSAAKTSPKTGDIYTDGTVNEEDARLLMMHLYFPDEYPIGQDVKTDVNDDGKTDDTDVAYILNYFESLNAEAGSQDQSEESSSSSKPSGSVIELPTIIFG